MYYLAYGSNLNLKEMKRRCPNAKVIGKYKLKGFRLIYKGYGNGLAFLTIEPSKDDIVPLGVYEVSEKDIKSLDIYEGFPSFYSKKYIEIIINGEKHKALIYIMNESFKYNMPSYHYVLRCAKGYMNFKFNLKILHKALKDTNKIMNETKKQKLTRNS